MNSAKEFGSKAWKSLSSAFGLEDQEEQGQSSLLGQLSEASTLSRMQRLYGFGICFGIGLFFSLLSQLFILSPRRFGVCYTFGNILCLGSMMFLMGPWNQVKNMFNKGRWIATLLYLGALVGTLYAAIGLRSTLLTMLFTILQFCALIWYSLSYIPFGQQLLSRLCGACFADE
mmetsp:Transcript_19132/g.45618  ORF Transcript_19132/g.45618 Transcript_19132/m.45618 type:complete len:173 (+) Transcript_19132:313-831(+)